MVERTEVLCDLWEEGPAVLPPHSQLYHLEPVGVGSPMVESLTSYVKRLAEAHSVSVRALISGVIAPLWQQTTIYKNRCLDHRFVTRYVTNYLNHSVALNGPGRLTCDLVQALESLTLLHDLRFLTMLPWRGILSANKLLRRMQSWCPACYEGWREEGQIVYEPLLWTLEDVRVCHRHHSRLQTQCPHPNCSQLQPPLGSRSLPGCCSWCGQWLGIPSQCPAERDAAHGDNELEQQWMVNAVGELLSAAPGLSEPPNQNSLLSSIKDCCARKLTEGRTAELTSQNHPGAFPHWIYRATTPRVESLLRFCFALGASPCQLLTDAVEEAAVTAGGSKENPIRQRRKFDFDKVQPALEAVLHLGEAADSKTAREQHRIFDVGRMRSVLEVILQEEPPPSMKEVARRLEYHTSHFRKYFPELCRAISARYKGARKAQGVMSMQRMYDEVREVVFSISAKGYYPSCSEVRKCLKNPNILRAPQVRAVWKAALKELGWRK